MALPYRRETSLGDRDRLARRRTRRPAPKAADYLRFGIPHIWTPDPYQRTLQQADRHGIRDCPGLVVETDLVGQVDFNELFAQLDEPTE